MYIEFFGSAYIYIFWIFWLGRGCQPRLRAIFYSYIPFFVFWLSLGLFFFCMIMFMHACMFIKCIMHDCLAYSLMNMHDACMIQTWAIIAQVMLGRGCQPRLSQKIKKKRSTGVGNRGRLAPWPKKILVCPGLTTLGEPKITLRSRQLSADVEPIWHWRGVLEVDFWKYFLKKLIFRIIFKNRIFFLKLPSPQLHRRRDSPVGGMDCCWMAWKCYGEWNMK